MPRRSDPAGLESYLAFGSVQAPGTVVRGMRCLRPGHYAFADARGKMTGPVRYWAPAFAGAEAGAGRADDLYASLEEAVRLHWGGDVPGGIFLSGGIDSSCLVALADRVGGKSVQTFSVVFPENEFSEAPYSRLIAERFQSVGAIKP